MPAHRHGIGVMAQDGALFPHLSIADNIGFGMPRNVDKRDEHIAELAYVVGPDSRRRQLGPRDIARIMLRPEEVFLEPASPEQAANPPPNVVFGEVIESEFAGSVSTVAVRVLNSLDPPDATVIGSHPLILRRSFIDAPTVGAIVRVNVLSKAHVFD